MTKYILSLFTICIFFQPLTAQQSVARRWNEAILQAVREDLARPTVQARTLFHTSLAMYDSWAVYDTTGSSETYLLGKTVGTYTCTFDGIDIPTDVEAAREETMSYAVYRIAVQRYQNSPGAFSSLNRFRSLMLELGYDPNYNSADYANTNLPADLGNYLGYCIVFMGLSDGANEQYAYTSFNYYPVNPILIPANPGNPNLLDPNHWQPLSLSVAIDQNGNPIPSTQIFQSPEWGRVQPFALSEDELTINARNGVPYWVYHDPGPPPMLDTTATNSQSDEFIWNFSLVSIWQSQMDPTDGVMWDISPASIGNVQHYPESLAEMHDFYNLTGGGDAGIGRTVNPKTGQPYTPQMVPRADYTRALAEFWADGPNSETPPGHWFVIMNQVMDHPAFQRRYNGQGPLLDPLEYDVKAYFTLGGAVHDAAVAAWGIKGWYDGPRPISSIRYMADKGQSSDPNLPSYHPAGLKLVPGYIELIQEGDPLSGVDNENVGKIKLFTWRGHPYINDPSTDVAGVGWILAENWWSYQRPTFVTPPFAGYISGHSTYSRAAAETLTLLTGDEYFPGGMGEFHIPANQFLKFEHGPTVDFDLQWATYRDASDQTSLSRIWGGIHPPFDDIPGRLIGAEVGVGAFNKARTYFYRDEDNDGYFSYEDCDDHDASVHPNAAELCDGIDNDCNGFTDEGITLFAYYRDADSDGFGDMAMRLDTCMNTAPPGFVVNNLDCNDNDAAFNPDAVELCDGLDNNCNGMVDDSITLYTYYLDADGDGFGNLEAQLDTCVSDAPMGYVRNGLDCEDADAGINPDAIELCDGMDNNCNGMVDESVTLYTYYQDSDGDGFGDMEAPLDTCVSDAPMGYVVNALDCNDGDASIYPGAVEICDGLDNDCNGSTDDELGIYTYYMDSDGDGFGNELAAVDTCLTDIPQGFSLNGLDCDDSNVAINPNAPEIMDGLDNDCNGLIDDIVRSTSPDSRKRMIAYPNPMYDMLTLNFDFQGVMMLEVVGVNGSVLISQSVQFIDQTARLDISTLAPGVYILRCQCTEAEKITPLKIIKM